MRVLITGATGFIGSHIAKAAAHTEYNNTKMQADNYLQLLDNLAVILRPSWLYGERSRSFEVLCAFSALPMILVVGGWRVSGVAHSH